MFDRTIIINLGFAAASLALAACGAAPDVPDSLADELCEHLRDGPATAITATATTTEAPDATADHTRFDITVVATAGGNGGYVTYQAADATEYVFAFDRPVGVEVTGPSGDPVPLKSMISDSPDCPVLRQQNTYDLEVGQHTLLLGPIATTEVRMVVEASGEEHAGE